jgi:hypothetical protein
MGDSNTIIAWSMTGLLCAGFFERAYMKGKPSFFPDMLAPVVQCSEKTPDSRNEQITGFWSRQVPHFHKGKTEILMDIMGHT